MTDSCYNKTYVFAVWVETLIFAHVGSLYLSCMKLDGGHSICDGA